MIPNFLVHGGAWGVAVDEVESTDQPWRIPARNAEAALEAVRRAAEEGWRILQEGREALDAVEAAVRAMEDSPALNAGRGSALNAERRIEMDAILMDGATLNAGAVAAIPLVRNPISVARLVMERSNHVLLVGEGAQQFARSLGVQDCDPQELTVPWQEQRWEAAQGAAEASQLSTQPGTVGAVAIDDQGSLAAATSTGGTTAKLPGRVGDTPLVGAGAYADNRTGAASATGWGESIMKTLICRTACDLLAAGRDPQEAAQEAVDILGDRVEGHGGLILLDGEGGAGIAFNTPAMARAWVEHDGSIAAEV